MSLLTNNMKEVGNLLLIFIAKINLHLQTVSFKIINVHQTGEVLRLL